MEKELINYDFDYKLLPSIMPNEYSDINKIVNNIKEVNLNYVKVDSKTSLENIKNWLKFRIINIFLDRVYDCENSQTIKKIYQLLDWKQDNYDNINSFQTLWTTLIKGLDVTKKYTGKTKQEYENRALKLLKDNNGKVSKKQLLAVKLWQLDNIDNYKIPLDILNELCRLAYNTHTIGNFMPCPMYPYNGAKGIKNNMCDDRIDLFWKLLYSDKEIYYKVGKNVKKVSDEDKNNMKSWLTKERIDKYYLNDYFSFDNTIIIKPLSDNRIKVETEDKEIYDYLVKVNELIEKRGKVIFNNVDIYKVINR